MRNAPEILEVNDTQLEDVLRRIEGAVDEKDFALIRALFQSYTYVAGLVEDKNTSIRRLRQLFFGKRTGKPRPLWKTAPRSPHLRPRHLRPQRAGTPACLRAGQIKDQRSKPNERGPSPRDMGAMARTPTVEPSGRMFRTRL